MLAISETFSENELKNDIHNLIEINNIKKISINFTTILSNHVRQIEK